MYVGKGVAGQFGLGKMYGYLAFITGLMFFWGRVFGPKLCLYKMFVI